MTDKWIKALYASNDSHYSLYDNHLERAETAVRFYVDHLRMFGPNFKPSREYKRTVRAEARLICARAKRGRFVHRRKGKAVRQHAMPLWLVSR